MPVDIPSVVDAIGTDIETGDVVLTIADHLPWDEPTHFVALQNKINSYLGFIEQGELIENYPEAVNENVRINIVCKYAPSAQALDFINHAGEVAMEYGVNVSWEVFNA